MRNFFLALKLSTLLLWMLQAILLAGCSTERTMSRRVGHLFKESAMLSRYQVGFALQEMKTGKVIYEQDAHKYFTPASNTKLYTFYAGLKMLPDSVPALKYIERGDSLIFWGTGDPSFLQSVLKGQNAYKLLKNTSKKLFFAAGRYTGGVYGRGWAWDDYNDYYQAEISELPIKENLISVRAVNGQLKIEPATFRDCFAADSSMAPDSPFKATRDFDTNTFRVPALAAPVGYSQQIPYKTSTSLTLSILSDTLKKPVGLIQMKLPKQAKTVFNTKTDEVLREMMLPSDNFIAEQLLLVCASQLGEELNTEKVIRHIEARYLGGLPDKVKWIDGSGLSRYNLFTPADMAALLKLIYTEINDTSRLFSMLPAGGKSGTLKNAYPKTNHPFVYGKTGTLSNNHNQSGYLISKKGKTFVFSFMNNNFVEPTADVRKEMVKILTYIHENY